MEDRERQIEESRRRRFGARVPSFIRNFGAARQAKAANDALRRVLAHIGFKPGWHVIEFGAGDGAALQTFLDLGSPPDTLSGVEIQEGEAANGRARSMEAADDGGFVRVVARTDDHRLLGMQAVGTHISELSGEFALALEMGARLEDIAGTIHVHPTLSEAVHEAALRALGHAIHI